MLVLSSEWLVLPPRSDSSLFGSLTRAFLISSPLWGFQLDDRTNMQRAPDRAAISKSFLAVRTGCRNIKLNARLTPNPGKSIAATMEMALSIAGSPGYDTTVAP
jgi:hypothetical protein